MADLREWLRQVEEKEDLKLIEGAHWDLDIGFLTAYYWKEWKTSPALLFDKIQGSPPGFRVLSNYMMTPDRFALTFGLPQQSSDKDSMATLRK